MHNRRITKTTRTAQLAQEAFWAVVAREYPDIKSGDLDPMKSHLFDQACKDMVESWVRLNTYTGNAYEENPLA